MLWRILSTWTLLWMQLTNIRFEFVFEHYVVVVVVVIVGCSVMLWSSLFTAWHFRQWISFCPFRYCITCRQVYKFTWWQKTEAHLIFRSIIKWLNTITKWKTLKYTLDTWKQWCSLDGREREGCFKLAVMVCLMHDDCSTVARTVMVHSVLWKRNKNFIWLELCSNMMMIISIHRLDCS